MYMNYGVHALLAPKRLLALALLYGFEKDMDANGSLANGTKLEGKDQQQHTPQDSGYLAES